MLDLLILTELKMPLAVPDPDREISGEPGLQKFFSNPRALFWSKNKEGAAGPPGSSPGSATAFSW